jgi:hypothetical protein
VNLRSDPKLYQRGETIDLISRRHHVVNVSCDVRSKAQEVHTAWRDGAVFSCDGRA